MDRPPLLVLGLDEAATVLTHGPETKALMEKLLLAERKNGVEEQPEPARRQPLPHWQYRTLAELEAAAHEQ